MSIQKKNSMLLLIKALKFVNDASKANEFKPQCGEENLSPNLVPSCNLLAVVDGRLSIEL